MFGGFVNAGLVFEPPPPPPPFIWIPRKGANRVVWYPPYTEGIFFGLSLRQGVHTMHKYGLFLMQLRGEDILRAV